MNKHLKENLNKLLGDDPRALECSAFIEEFIKICLQKNKPDDKVVDELMYRLHIDGETLGYVTTILCVLFEVKGIIDPDIKVSIIHHLVRHIKKMKIKK